MKMAHTDACKIQTTEFVEKLVRGGMSVERACEETERESDGIPARTIHEWWKQIKLGMIRKQREITPSKNHPYSEDNNPTILENTDKKLPGGYGTAEAYKLVPIDTPSPHFRTVNTGENEWYTPSQHIELAREVLGVIDFDPASSEQAQKRIKAARYCTKNNSGLTQPWKGRVWLNPPYSQPDIQLFIEKLVFEIDCGNVSEAIILTHNYTDTAWFHLAESAATSICFTRGRIRFEDQNGNLAAPTQGQAFFYYGRNPSRFAEVFKNVGFIR
jgi:phage N-6-adenine-methyltransferase